MSKQKRYRLACQESACCSHCGRDCWPYTICAERRAYKRRWYAQHKKSARTRAPYGPTKPKGFNAVQRGLDAETAEFAVAELRRRIGRERAALLTGQFPNGINEP